MNCKKNILFIYLFFGVFQNYRAQNILPYVKDNYCLDNLIPVNAFTNNQTKNLVVKDLNGDSIDDIIVSSGGPFVSAIICYSFQTLSKTFVQAQTINVNYGISTGYIKQAIDVGEFNGNINPDIVFTSDSIIYFCENSGNFLINLFSTTISIPSKYKGYNHYLKVTDLNDDNKDDFYFISENLNKGLSVLCYQQTANFTFTLANTYEIFGSFIGGSIGNLDINIGNIDNSTSGKNDAMFTHSGIPDSVYFFKNISTPSVNIVMYTLKTKVVNTSSVLNTTINGSELVDLNGDSVLDFVFNTESFLSNRISIYSGTANYNLSSPINFSLGNVKFNDFKFKDITDDGIVDFCGIGTIFSSTINVLGIFPGNKTNTYFDSNSPTLITFNNFTSPYFADELEIADVDTNGVNDIIFKPRGLNIDKTQMIPNFTFGTSVTPLSAVVCGTNNVTFTATSSAPKSNFEWFNITSGTSVSPNETLTTNISDSYAAKLSFSMYSGNDCYIHCDTVVVSADNPPIVILSQSVASACYNQNVFVTATGATKYLWFNSTSTTSISNSPTFSVQALSNSNYTVIGLSVGGCTNSQVFTLNLFPLNTNKIIATKNPICVGDSITLSFLSTTSYTWSNGIINKPGITVNPTTNTTYSLSYEYGNNCFSDKTIDILIDPSCEQNNTLVYNAITPNNDGNNDAFFIEDIEKYVDNQISIYNRWGGSIITIKKYNNTTNFWPKKDDYAHLVSGTYFYILNYGNGKVRKGWIELINN